jgi:hypothetical protein
LFKKRGSAAILQTRGFAATQDLCFNLRLSWPLQCHGRDLALHVLFNERRHSLVSAPQSQQSQQFNFELFTNNALVDLKTITLTISEI